MAAYIARRKSGNDDSSGNFFKKVDSLIPKRKKISEEVPDLDGVNPTVIDRPKKQFWLFALFSSRRPSSDEDDFESLDEDDQEVIEELEEEIEEVEEEVEDLEAKKASLFSRLFGFLRSSKSDSFEDDGEDIDPELVASTISQQQKNEDLINETRIVLKSLHRWLSKLPPEQIEAFKRSPDFNRYKELLDKYGLIR